MEEQVTAYIHKDYCVINAAAMIRNYRNGTGVRTGGVGWAVRVGMVKFVEVELSHLIWPDQIDYLSACNNILQL